MGANGRGVALIYGRIYVVPRPLRFCASTFGTVCGNRYEKLCRFSFIFSSHHRETSPHSTVNLHKTSGVLEQRKSPRESAKTQEPKAFPKKHSLNS
ncbi:hypothetical protein DVH24_004767 [Malus domestica]|uniref:Uncharacterized protein n=1 Tax=Malus domestica TaxID=3750 RepID=A0A498II04_MALDO|nr:hypothetical protein DVH24_004767 [Malus domestica]